jgi:hypothetical protein
MAICASAECAGIEESVKKALTMLTNLNRFAKYTVASPNQIINKTIVSLKTVWMLT